VWRDRFGCIWMRSLNDASYQCPGDRRPTTLPTSVVSIGGPQIHELKDGRIILPSFGKIAIGRPGNFRVLTAHNGYPSTGASVVTKDGNLWLNNTNGLFIMPSHLQMEFWTERDGLEFNTWSVLRLGNRIFAIAGDSICVLAEDRSHWRRLASVARPTHLLTGPDNTLLVGTRSGGIVQLSLAGKILRKSAAAQAMMLARAPDGQYWVAGSSAARIVFLRGRLDLENAPVPEPHDGGKDIKIGPDGGLWECDDYGLLHKDETRWRTISKADGLQENACMSLAIDRNGNIWYVYRNLGLSLIRNAEATNPQFQHFQGAGKSGSFPSSFLNSDRRGWLWRGAPDGV
jgi:ligand-binding sensor domain-containing protein